MLWWLALALPQERYDFGGALVGREDRIKDLPNDAVVDDQHHALEQDHAGDGEGRQIERAGERQLGIRQKRKRQMQPLSGLSLIGRVLGREAENMRYAERLSSAKWSRNAQDCGVQPRAPGISSQPRR